MHVLASRERFEEPIARRRFTTSGEDSDLEWLREKMDSRFQIKTQMIGETHLVEGKVLNIIIRLRKMDGSMKPISGTEK